MSEISLLADRLSREITKRDAGGYAKGWLNRWKAQEPLDHRHITATQIYDKQLRATAESTFQDLHLGDTNRIML
jgi:hypothetical protein